MMCGVTWSSYLWIMLLLTSLRRGLVFAKQSDTIGGRQQKTEFTPDTETQRDDKHDKTKFTTDIRTILAPGTYRSGVEHVETEFVTDTRTTLAPGTYRSAVEHDETEFTTDTDATSTASTHVSDAAATAADPPSSQPPCKTDAGTDRTSPSKTGLVTNSEKDFASTSETSPRTDVETIYTKDMAGGLTGNDEMRVLTTGISHVGVTSATPASEMTVGVTGNTNVTLTAVTPTLVTLYRETENVTSVLKMLASTNEMASDDNDVFITGIAGGLGTVLVLTALITVYICRRRSRGIVSLRLSGDEGDLSRVYIHLHRRRSQEPMNQVYEASNKLRPSATQELSGIYTEIGDDLRRTLSARGKVKASFELRKDYTSKTRRKQGLEQEMTNFQDKRRPSVMKGESRIYTEIPEVLDTSSAKDSVPTHVSALRGQLYKRSKRRLQRPDMMPGLPKAGVCKRGPSLKKESGIYTEITASNPPSSLCHPLVRPVVESSRVVPDSNILTVPGGTII